MKLIAKYSKEYFEELINNVWLSKGLQDHNNWDNVNGEIKVKWIDIFEKNNIYVNYAINVSKLSVNKKIQIEKDILNIKNEIREAINKIQK